MCIRDRHIIYNILYNIIYIRALPPAAGPLATCYSVTGKWWDWQVCGTGGILNTQTCHFGGLGTPFWHPGTPFWHQLVTKGCPGTSRMAPWGPLMDFLWFLTDSVILLGTIFWSISEYLRDLGCQMDGLDASVDFLVIWGWKSCQNWMLGCAGTTQKKDGVCDV